MKTTLDQATWATKPKRTKNYAGCLYLVVIWLGKTLINIAYIHQGQIIVD